MSDDSFYRFDTELPEDAKAKHVLVTAIAQIVKGEEVKEISLRLQRLRSQALKRSIEGRASGSHYAANCVLCKGTGRVHFCIDPFCHSLNELEQDDCLHFTPDELKTYMEIHRDYAGLLLGVDALIKGSGADILTFMGLLKMGNTTSKKNHGFN